MDIRKTIIEKLNEIVPNKKLNLSEQEVKYIIRMWVEKEYPEYNISSVNFYHYSEPDDPQEKEKIGVNILLQSQSLHYIIIL